MSKNHLQKAFERRSELNIIDSADYDMDMDEFICHLINVCQPMKYGLEFPKKVCYDSNYAMKEISGTMDRGDCVIGNSKYAELKISVVGDTKKKYNIRNIRKWQDFDYYILCLVYINSNTEEFNVRYYCVDKDVITNNPALKLSYQNGTAKSNANNENPGLVTQIPHEDVSWYFKKKNLLEGTSYKHLLKFIDNIAGVTSNSNKITKVEEIEVPVNRKYRPVSVLSYMYKGKRIKGNSNKDTMFNLVKTIGPKKLDGIIWRSQLGKEKKPLHEYVGDGYYFNPKFSLRDTLTTIKMINKKTNLNVELIKQ